MPDTPNASTDKALRSALAVTGWPDDLGVAEPSQPSETARPAGLRWLPAGESVVLARATLGGRPIAHAHRAFGYAAALIAVGNAFVSLKVCRCWKQIQIQR
jgi:hypothetical protein